MAVNLELAPANAGKRLGAAVLDWLAPLAVLVVTFAIGFAGVTRTQSGGFIIYDTASLVIFGGIGTGLTLVYLFVVLSLEGRSGNTIGNQLMGIRSADNDGYAPGGGVFLRGLITGAGVLLAVAAAIVVIIFKWFDIALLVLGPLAFIGAAWAVLVVVSSTWDKNGGLRGWHDTAAKTLVFDIKAGRNPITSGGIQGPYSFAPLDLPPVQQVASPVARAIKAPQVINAQVPPNPTQWQPPAAPVQAASVQAAPDQPAPFQPAPVQPYAATQPFSNPQAPGTPQERQVPPPAVPQAPAPQQFGSQQFAPQQFAPESFAQPAAAPTAAPAAAPTAAPAAAPTAGPAATGHPDDDHDRTQLRGGLREPAPMAVLRIRLDDGRDFQLDRSVLVGRDPVGQAGEQQAQLLAVTDPGRSISKTHLHLLSDGAGIWVTDRNSTNGSAVTTPDGLRTPLQPGVPAFVSPGSTVHFGDRTFHLGQA